MFERVVLHERTQGLPGSPFDYGFLAETMIFYGHTHVVVGRGNLPGLVNAFGPETLVEYLREGYLTMTYQPNFLATISNNDAHDLGVAGVQGSSLQDVAQEVLVGATGKAGRGRRLARQLRDLVKEQPLRDELAARARKEWTDVEHVQRCVQSILETCAPGYKAPSPTIFRVHEQSNGEFRVETNVDFSRANASYHEAIPESHSSLSPAYLLSHLAETRRHIEMAAEYEADFATNAVSARLIELRLGRSAERAFDRGIQAFQEVVLDGLPSIREAINSGGRTFRDLRVLLQRAKDFRSWLADKSPKADLLTEYHREVTRESWADKLPSKAVRFTVFNAFGLALDAAGAGGVGTAASLAASAVDSFILDKVIRGWRPNQFVEGPLRDFLRPGK